MPGTRREAELPGKNRNQMKAGYVNPPESQVRLLTGDLHAEVLSLRGVWVRLRSAGLCAAPIEPLRSRAGPSAATPLGDSARALLPAMPEFSCAHACWPRIGLVLVPTLVLAPPSVCAHSQAIAESFGQRWRATRGQTGHLTVQQPGHLVASPPGAPVPLNALPPRRVCARGRAGGGDRRRRRSSLVRGRISCSCR